MKTKATRRKDEYRGAWRTARRTTAALGAASLVLLAAMVTPLAAEEAQGAQAEFRLHLEDTPAAEAWSLELPDTAAVDPGPEFETEPAEAAPHPAVEVAGLRSMSTARRSWAAPQAQPDAPTMPKKRGFGRWLKKHWYVPVLVGAAIGALALDDGSDSPDDVEDDD